MERGRNNRRSSGYYAPRDQGRPEVPITPQNRGRPQVSFTPQNPGRPQVPFIPQNQGCPQGSYTLQIQGRPQGQYYAQNQGRLCAPFNTQDQARPCAPFIPQGQVRPQGPCIPKNKLQELNDLLMEERAKSQSEYQMRMQLTKELDDAKQQLARQKTLKEMYINKEKDTRKELERLKRVSEPETMTNMKIATLVQETLKTKKKKVLQNEYEELRVEYIISQDKFSAQLGVEKAKNEALLKELEQLKLQVKQINLNYEAPLKAEKEAFTNQELITQLQTETEVNKNLRNEVSQLKEHYQDKSRQQENKSKAFEKQVEDLKAQLQTAETLSGRLEEKVMHLTTELESLQEQVGENQLLQQKNSSLQDKVRELKVTHTVNQVIYSAEIQVEKDANHALQQELVELKEKETLFKQMQKEIQTLKEYASQKEKLFFKELEDLKDRQASACQELVAKLKAETEVNENLCTELTKLKMEHQNKTKEQEREKEALKKQVEDLQEEQAFAYQEVNTKLQIEREVNKNLQTELDKLKKEQQDKTMEQEALKKQVEDLQEKQASANQALVTVAQIETPNLQTELIPLKKEHQDMTKEHQTESPHDSATEGSEQKIEEQKKNPSFWKRFRPRIGLRKTKKKPEEES